MFGCAGYRVTKLPTEADLETRISKSGLDIDLNANNMVDEAFGGVDRDVSDDVSTLLACANFAAIRTAAGLAIGTDVAAQAHNHSGVYEPVDATILRQADVDDTPVDNVTTAPISSNWAYDHVAAADPHTVYVLESAIGNTVQAQTSSASQAEMEEGTEAALRAMSPLRIAQAITAQAGTGSGDLKADGTVPLTADWDAVKAITAESFTSAKVSGVAGRMALYEKNSTDVDYAGLEGADSMSANTSYTLKFPNAAPTSGMSLTFSGTASTGSGTPSNPYVHAGSWNNQALSFVIPAPAATDDINLMKAPYAMKIIAINCIVQGTTSATGQLQECGADGTSCADLDSDIACDADGAADDGALTDSAIAANAWVRWKTTSVSGTPTFLTVTVKYTW